MYNLKLNNWHIKPKNSTIYTPPEVSEFLFKLLKDKFSQASLIFDPCSGAGSLLMPWKEAGYPTWGVDIQEHQSVDLVDDFFTLDKFYFQVYEQLPSPKLILCNPPFNGAYPQLAPEVWLDKIIELFGKNIPLVLFVPAGFRLNLTLTSKRYLQFLIANYSPISSIISLPKNIFAEVKFHSEILIFNIKDLQPHYFYQPNHEI